MVHRADVREGRKFPLRRSRSPMAFRMRSVSERRRRCSAWSCSMWQRWHRASQPPAPLGCANSDGVSPSPLTIPRRSSLGGRQVA